MGKHLPFIESAVSLLEKHNLIDSLIPLNSFHDEPYGFYYGATLLPQGKNMPIGKRYYITGDGFSFFSPEIALSKTLGEYLERLSQMYFTNKGFSDYKSNNSFPLIQYTQSLPTQFVWAKGKNISTDSSSLIPAQLLYLSYDLQNEPLLTTQISTGAAGGFSPEEAILNGIYEVAERDAIMATYLHKISIPRINLSDLRNNKLQEILVRLRDNKLAIYSFLATNDLAIPTVLTILIDKTGFGPAISVGSKTSLDTTSALIGSIGEAVINHIWTRKKMYKQKNNIIPIEKNSIITREERALYWSTQDKLPYLDFLIRRAPTATLPNSPAYKTSKDELDSILRLMKKKGIQVYTADIKHPILSPLMYHVYKTIIPGLQPLYLNEQQKEINNERLKKISNHFSQPSGEHNGIPHPFL